MTQNCIQPRQYFLCKNLMSNDCSVHDKDLQWFSPVSWRVFLWVIIIMKGLDYRSPIKLREDNVFSRVCQSVCSKRGVPCDYYPWCIGPPYTSTPPQTCSNLFNLDLTVQGHPPSHPVQGPLPPSSSTVGKRMVRILLKCFLVISISGQYNSHYNYGFAGEYASLSNPVLTSIILRALSHSWNVPFRIQLLPCKLVI